MARLPTAEELGALPSALSNRTARIGWRLLMTIGSVVLALAGTAGALAAKWMHVAGGLQK